MKVNEIKNYTIASQATIKDSLRKINDFVWLREQYDKLH